MTQAYDKQRREGAEKVLRKAQDLAEVAGIELTRIAFDDGREIVLREKHVLILALGEKVVQIGLSDEALADYPGRVGTEATIAMLCCGINELL